MPSRQDSTQNYMRIKEQTQNKYDNNITIIIYIYIYIYYEIKLHSESNSSYLMCGKYLLTTCIHGMPEWPLSAICLGILDQNDFIGI